MRHILFSALLLFAVCAVAQDAGTAPASSTITTTILQDPSAPAPREQGITTTELPNSDDPDPLMEVPPMPEGKTSFIGGSVKNIDPVRNRLTLAVFGGGTMKFRFDERTRVYRDGVETTYASIKKNQRVYVDSMLDRGNLFARNIRVQTQLQRADAKGQIMDFDADDGVITLRDHLSARPIAFRVTPTTTVENKGASGSRADLRDGALVEVTFAPEKANRGIAEKISVIATPGQRFLFVGRVTHLDLKESQIAVENRTDGKTYDLAIDEDNIQVPEDLVVGSEVRIEGVFRGSGYDAQSLTLLSNGDAAATDTDAGAAPENQDPQ